MAMARRLLQLLATALLLVFLPPTDASKFSCRSRGGTRCQSLIGYAPRNDTTLADVMSLFQIRSFRSLLAANGLPLATPPSRPVPAGSTVRVRLACSCSAGHGATARRPIYRIGLGDSLDAVARGVFNGLVTYEEIAAANNISDPNLVRAGQEVYVPLPCSCDDVGGEAVVHYAHVVVAGSTVSSIAEELGAKEEDLMTLNGIRDPTSLEAGQVLDVPLKACSSSISNSSPDHGIHISNGSYILKAKNCVLCSCSSSTWQLDCHLTKGLSSSVCPAATCGELTLGNSSSNTTCESTTCAYSGYTNSTSFTILTNLTTQSTCNTSGAPMLQPSDASSLRLVARWPHLVLPSVCLSMAVLASPLIPASTPFLRSSYWILRHGKSIPNEKGIIISSLENGTLEKFGLASEGFNQARLAGELLLKELKEKNVLLETVRICYSPFSRTADTAKVVADVLSISFDSSQCKAMTELRERYFGPSFELLSHEKYAEIWSLDEQNPFQPPEGGESAADVASRLTAALAEIEAEFQGCTILVVSHGDPLQILQTILDAVKQLEPSDKGDFLSKAKEIMVHSVLCIHRKFALETGELRQII